MKYLRRCPSCRGAGWRFYLGPEGRESGRCRACRGTGKQKVETPRRVPQGRLFEKRPK